MKVNIGRYVKYIGPSAIAETLLFWLPKDHSLVERFGDYLMDTEWVCDVCCWVEQKRSRKISVRIDPWDTWSADDTLAHVILPLLKEFKKELISGPYVDPKDVPKNLRPKKLTKKQEDTSELDSTYFERWDWVLDEMIWAFEHKVGKYQHWEEQYHTGKRDVVLVPVDKDGNALGPGKADGEPNIEAEFFRIEKTENDTSHFDAEGCRAHQERITNGFKLFGKYYEGLWN